LVLHFKSSYILFPDLQVNYVIGNSDLLTVQKS
jgi:hypothetical protein